jgi:hypothetical protein
MRPLSSNSSSKEKKKKHPRPNPRRMPNAYPTTPRLIHAGEIQKLNRGYNKRRCNADGKNSLRA